MCTPNGYIVSGIVIFVLVVAVSYIDLSPEDSSDFDIDDSCPTGTSAVTDSGSCDRNPRSKVSCCALNPIIKSQVQSMLDESLFTRVVGSCTNGESVCLPNVGSRYLGATVANIRDTKPYKHPLGTPESEKTNKPSVVLEANPVVVGKNWHFVGVGTLVVRLFYPCHISGFTVVHAPKCQIPSGFETSAPKNFQVMGMKTITDAEPFQFGNYTYDINGPAVQIFPVQRCCPDKYQFIEFRFTSNHGNPDYTTLYQIRIHGDIGAVRPNINNASVSNGNETSDRAGA